MRKKQALKRGRTTAKRKTRAPVNGFRSLFYAPDDQGKYKAVVGPGPTWEKEIRAEMAESAREREAAALDQVRKGALSPIGYFMAAHKMDEVILSKITAISRWRIKRHLKPSLFRKLGMSVLQKYASAFETTAAHIRDFANHA